MVAFDPWATWDEDQKQAEEGGSSTFKPLPAGPRDFNLFEAEIVPYTKKADSPYAGLYALKVQIKVPDGEEFANRRVFSRVPLFPKSPPAGPNAKEPGAQYVQYDFFNFFQKSLGWDADKLKTFAGHVRGGDVASATKMIQPSLGKRVRAVLKVTPPDEYNPDGGNDVKAWAASAGAVKPAATVADAWGAASSTATTSATESPWGGMPTQDAGLAAAAANSQGF